MNELEQRVAAAAEATGAAFRVMPCDSELADTAEFCAHYGIAPADSANTIVVASKTDPVQFVACVVLATTRLDVNGVVPKRMGVRKASFAPAEMTAAVTGMVMGGVMVFGLPPELPVWVDAAVMHRAEIVVGGGSRSQKIVTSPDALTKLTNVEVVDGLANLIE
jgi:prolyl-tRNA editing enzyme YbaK/EbsC (Cys-tRNA(Pro) deacylase)